MTRHARALAVSSILTIVAFCGLYFLWTTHSISTWLLAVSGFSLEVICKVFASLALYGLFLIDAKLSEFWDKLDDHVYCVRYKYFATLSSPINVYYNWSICHLLNCC